MKRNYVTEWFNYLKVDIVDHLDVIELKTLKKIDLELSHINFEFNMKIFQKKRKGHFELTYTRLDGTQFESIFSRKRDFMHFILKEFKSIKQMKSRVV